MAASAVEGEPPVSPGNEPAAETSVGDPGITSRRWAFPSVKGGFSRRENTADQPRVVVINETLARQFFNSRDPLGRRLKAGGAWRTVVGVVSDVKSSSLESNVRPQLYVPHAQDPWPPMTVVLRTASDPLGARIPPFVAN